MYSGISGAFANPQSIVTHFHLKEGDVVADVGAGSGEYMKLLSDAVGVEGKVYVGDIQKSLVDALDIKAQGLHLTNVRPIWCDVESPNGTKLKDGILDALLLSNVFFQFEDKASALSEVKRVLRRGGRLIFIDWTESFNGLGPQPAQVVSRDSARTLIEGAGFTYVSDFPAGDHHYGFIFRT